MDMTTWFAQTKISEQRMADRLAEAAAHRLAGETRQHEAERPQTRTRRLLWRLRPAALGLRAR
jgi:hypothetical protein